MVVDSTAGFRHSMVADSTPDFLDSTVANFTPPFANFTAADSTTAILANSTGLANSTDFITMASAAASSWLPPSAAGGGVADGVGPIIIIQTARITGTDLMQVTGIIAPIRRATTLM